MSDVEILSTSRCFGGEQRVLRHQSAETGTPMRFAAFVPPQALAARAFRFCCFSPASPALKKISR